MDDTRNSPKVFAQRSLKNLDFIRRIGSTRPDAAPGDRQAHVNTQLLLTLLGIVVMANEKEVLGASADLPLADMTLTGWPQWIAVEDGSTHAGRRVPTRTLGDLVYHLRNSISHCLFSFSGDEGMLESVTVILRDRVDKSKPFYWEWQIPAVDLQDFAARIVDLMP